MSLRGLVISFVAVLVFQTALPAGQPAIDITEKTQSLVSLDEPDEQPVLREIELPKFQNACYFSSDIHWLGAANRILPWVTGPDLKQWYEKADKQNPAVKSANRRGVFMLVKLEDGDFLVLFTLAGPYSCSYLEVSKNGELFVGYSSEGTDPPQKGPIPILAWARSEDVYEAFNTAWDLVLDMPTSKNRVRLRGQKNYPEQFRYLGWCSWEQFRRDISEKLLVDVVDQIEKSDIPVRWMLIDDGHQVHDNARRSVDQSLVSLEPDPKKFPNGWKPLLDKRNPDFVKWIGIWHAHLGLWNNISAKHEMPFLAPYLVPKNNKKGSSLIPRPDAQSSRAFYDAFIGKIAQQGFDFVKIDNMSRTVIQYSKKPNGVYGGWLNYHSLDLATKKHNLPLICCMAQNTVSFLNSWHSTVMRCSIDYRLNNEAYAKSHVYQSFANTLWLGQILWPDHDMFHSSDPFCGELMAVTKALSGAPIYLSDKPADFRKDYIKPLCYEDGLLLRPLAPAVPLPDSVMLDALNDPSSAYQVIAPLENTSVAIAGFNLVYPTLEKPIQGKITKDDYLSATALMGPQIDSYLSASENLVIYDWRKGRGQKLTAAGHNYEIEGFDYKLFILSPVSNGWAVIGRPDKYLSPAAVTKIETTKETLKLTLQESGPVVIYSDKGAVKCDKANFKDIGNGFWLAEMPISKAPLTLEVYR